MSKYFALTGDGGGGGGSYTLPTATANTLGGVKIGENVNISNGKISVDLSAYATKTPATHTKDGLMTKDDKTKLDGMSEYVLPTASADDLGGVKIGNGIQIANGKISVSFSDYYTKTETEAKITESTPTKLSELQNDENYIKNTADNLLNYYKKTDTYSQTEVNDLIGNINKLTSEIVTVLPTENISTSTIYLIKAEDTNVYSQYMYIGGTWAELGTTTIDLSNYYTKSETDTKLADKISTSDLETHTSDVVVHITADERTAWNGAVSKAHEHVNADTLNATEESFTTAKQTAYDKAVEDDHTHENKTVIDKFSESADGKVLYDSKEIAGGNVWHGTKAEYDLIETKDPEITYVVTDKTDSVANYVIDDTAVSDETTWSSEKIQSAVTPINIIDITQDIDLNDFKATGYYTPNVSFSTGVFTHNILHAPTNGWLPAGGFALEVKNFSSNWNTQVLYSYVGADNASAPMWTRTFFYDSNSGSVFTPWKRIADIDDNKISSDETWSSKKISSQKFLATIPLLSLNKTLSISSSTPTLWENEEILSSLIPSGTITRWRYILTGVSQSSGTITIGNTTIALKNDEVSTEASYIQISTWTNTHLNALVNIVPDVAFYAKELSIQIEYTQN